MTVTHDSFFKTGTWDVMFEAPLRAPIGSRVGLAIVSVKHELVFNGIPVGGMNLDVPEIGSGTERAISLFQKRNGLVVDGSCGPKTALVLMRKRSIEEALRIGAPRMLVAQQKSLESVDDFACVSENEEDRGPSQINKRFHPEVTDAKAYTVSFCLHWQADYLREAYDDVLTTKGKRDWDLALAAYNVGWGPARKWDEAGRPVTNPDGKPNVAAQYVRVVKSRSG